MTNREWLMEQMQNMSDEKLGAILDLSEYIKKECYDCCDTSITCDKCNAHWLKAEHKEVIKLSDAERVVLENIDKRWVWICRNEDGNLRVMGKRPKKYTKVWMGEIGGYADIDVFDHLFQFIKWSDNEPYEIAELLRGE